MKYLIFLLLYTHIASAASLPSNWVSETSQKSSPESASKNLAETYNYIDSVLGIQEKVLLGREDKTSNGFKFTHYVTEFSLSKSGLFGLSALKATTAVEVKWSRSSLAKMKTLEVVSDLEVTDDSVEALALTATQLEALALSTGKVDPSPVLRNNIEVALNRVKTMTEQMDHIDFPGWKLASLRLDLSIGANGQVWTFANAGATVRLRLDWKKIKTSSGNKGLVKNHAASFINKILYDFNQVYKEQDLAGFKVKMVNVGVGLSRKGGFLGLSSTKMGIMGYLRFVPVPSSHKTAVPVIEADSAIATDDIEYLSEEEESLKSFGPLTLKRSKWRAGLVKGLEMAKFFAGSASRFQNNWQVNEIKTVFELTKNGFLGLAASSATGAIETELVRK